jgi:hypothetical protein
LGGIHVGLRVRVLDTIVAYGYVSVTFYILALSSDSGFRGFGCPRVVFLFSEFPLRQQIFFVILIPHF